MSLIAKDAWEFNIYTCTIGFIFIIIIIIFFFFFFFFSLLFISVRGLSIDGFWQGGFFTFPVFVGVREPRKLNSEQPGEESRGILEEPLEGLEKKPTNKKPTTTTTTTKNHQVWVGMGQWPKVRTLIQAPKKKKKKQRQWRYVWVC